MSIGRPIVYFLLSLVACAALRTPALSQSPDVDLNSLPLPLDSHPSPNGELVAELFETNDEGYIVTIRHLRTGKRTLLTTLGPIAKLQSCSFLDKNRIIVLTTGNMSLGTTGEIFVRDSALDYKSQKNRFDPFLSTGISRVPNDAAHLYFSVDGYAASSTILVSVRGDRGGMGPSNYFGPCTLRFDYKTNKIAPSKHNEGSGGTRPQMSLQPLDGYGSGFFVSEDGLIATCLHVVAKKDARGGLGAMGLIRIITSVGGEPLNAEIVAYDPENDIALLRAKCKPPSVCFLEQTVPSQVGLTLCTIGFPNPQERGFASKTEWGVLTDPREYDSEFTATVSSSPGHSGGAVFTERGEVLGLVTHSVAGTRKSFVTKSSSIAALVKRVKGSLVQRRKVKNRDSAVSNCLKATVRIQVYD